MIPRPGPGGATTHDSVPIDVFNDNSRVLILVTQGSTPPSRCLQAVLNFSFTATASVVHCLSLKFIRSQKLAPLFTPSLTTRSYAHFIHLLELWSHQQGLELLSVLHQKLHVPQRSRNVTILFHLCKGSCPDVMRTVWVASSGNPSPF